MERVIGEATRLSSQWKHGVKEGFRLMAGNPILPSQASQDFSKIEQVFGLATEREKIDR